MRGTIVHYNASDGRGLIAADDGCQYVFGITAWRSGIAPQVNQAVDLDACGQQATGVSLIPARVLLRERIHRLLAPLWLRRPGSRDGTGNP